MEATQTPATTDNSDLALARLSAANHWLRGEVRRLDALVATLRREVRTQRLEIAGLREERRAILEADRPQMDSLDTGET